MRSSPSPGRCTRPSFPRLRLKSLGGGLAGNQIEKNAKKTKEYQIFVRYEDGTKGMFTQPTPPSWRIGDKVKVINGVIQTRG